MEAAQAPSRTQTCERFVEDQDVQGLLEYLRSLRVSLSADFSLSVMSRCIRAKARDDLSGLSEDIFGAILALGMTMLCRCQLHIEKRLADTVALCHDSSPPIPADLVHEGWLDRAERISRFCAEMAALRARVLHLNGMNHERSPADRTPSEARLRAAMEDGESQAGAGEGIPASCRQRA